MDLVSILMPAYNRADYIAESIRSVQAQTWQNWELLIVNDGSKDNTAEIVAEYSSKDPRVILINQPNAGCGAARNTGLSHAKGNWIAYLDSDDLWTPDKLEIQLAAAAEHPDVDVIYSRGWMFFDTDLTNREPYNSVYGVYEGKDMYRMLYRRNDIPILSVIVKRSMVDKVGPQSNITIEDYDYWMRIGKAGGRFYGIDQALFFYRRHGTSIMSETLKIQKAELDIMLNNFSAEAFTPAQVKQVFTLKTDYLVLGMLDKNRHTEIAPLMAQVNKIRPSLAYRLTNPMVQLLGKRAHWPLKALYKLHRVGLTS